MFFAVKINENIGYRVEPEKEHTNKRAAMRALELRGVFPGFVHLLCDFAFGGETLIIRFLCKLVAKTLWTL